jgi:hypothetical protein
MSREKAFNNKEPAWFGKCSEKGEATKFCDSNRLGIKQMVGPWEGHPVFQYLCSDIR